MVRRHLETGDGVVMARVRFARYGTFASFQRPGVRSKRRGQPAKDGTMNRTEEAYAAHLETRTDVVAWYFQSSAFRLADKTFFYPDFKVVIEKADMSLWVEYHDTKDFWMRKNAKGERVEDASMHVEDDARVKMKVAAKFYPEEQFVMVGLRKTTGQWEEVRL